MIVYVGAGSGPLRDLIIAAGHGQMVSRQTGSFRIPKYGRWAFDNGAFIDWKHGVPFDNEEYLRRIRRINELPDERLPDWCVCPDIVGTRSSLAYSLEWKSVLSKYAPRLKWYLALQDHFHPDDVAQALSMEHYDGLFIGGTTPWKLSTSPAWVEFGHQRGLPVHIARVNGPNRLQWSVNIGADSVDGTGWVHAGEKWLPYLQNVPKKEVALFEESTEFPEEWVAFGAWLKDVWKDPAEWSRRYEDEHDQYEWVDSVWSMEPAEWIEWFNRSYGLSIRLPEFSTPEEFREWAFENLAYAEHHAGMKPAPPLPEKAAFVVDAAGVLVPLSRALGPHRAILRDASGKEFLVIQDSSGTVLDRSPIIRALSIEAALERAKEIYQGQVRLEEHAKTMRPKA